MKGDHVMNRTAISLAAALMLVSGAATAEVLRADVGVSGMV